MWGVGDKGTAQLLVLDFTSRVPASLDKKEGKLIDRNLTIFNLLLAFSCLSDAN